MVNAGASATSRARLAMIGASRHWRLILTVLGGVGLLLVVTGVLAYNLQPRDSHAYWSVDPVDPYRNARLGGEDAFLYAPVVAQLLGPFTHLPFDVFRIGYGLMEIAALAIGGIGYTLLMPGVIEDIVRGNIHILMAVAILAGFRFPGAWATILLTKVTPGIGLLWFAVRRDWRALAQVTLVTLVIVGVSVVLGGVRPWQDWLSLLTRSAESPQTYRYLGLTPPGLIVRLPIAAAVVAWGAWSNRRWTVPVAAFLALPVIWPSGFAVLAAVPPLWLADRRRATLVVNPAAGAA